ncbi:muconolactone Delta-isomerase family protein [Sphaerisporangium sp. TRM90804]|uniref:muconolactone Delta-isomerase family protein n=1 Tax=Sphaerisporangium sp. TRM90804 TaxID=3031113 RepID=UPI002447A350|nr:muconolactone Delta-isomerase family protein [Sphaerisporangium sp. TRM90804]MDH2428025.1 muconolactone Delta-isomerase family protein [Sphaerisporangium sp. TRM90804]
MALFAVIAKKAPIGISVDEFNERLAEGFKYTKEMVDKGVLKHRWILVGASAGLNIYEVDSHEHLMKVLYDSPVGSHLQFDVYPLIDPSSFNPTGTGPDAAQGS